MKTIRNKEVFFVRTMLVGGHTYNIRNEHGVPVSPQSRERPKRPPRRGCRYEPESLYRDFRRSGLSRLWFVDGLQQFQQEHPASPTCDWGGEQCELRRAEPLARHSQCAGRQVTSRRNASQRRFRHLRRAGIRRELRLPAAPRNRYNELQRLATSIGLHGE